MVRRHRLLETFLHRALHVPLERVHAEAERIEHVISDDVALRIADLLAPARVRSARSSDSIRRRGVETRGVPSLASLTAGATARVVSLDDRDDEGVAALAAAGVLPGVTLRVESSGRDRLAVRCGKRTAVLRRRHAAMVRIAT